MDNLLLLLCLKRQGIQIGKPPLNFGIEVVAGYKLSNLFCSKIFLRATELCIRIYKKDLVQKGLIFAILVKHLMEDFERYVLMLYFP